MKHFNLKNAVREQLNPDGRTGRMRFCLLILLGTAVAALNLLESAWFMYFYVLEHLYRRPSLFGVWIKIAFAGTCLLAQIPVFALIWRLAFLSAVRRLNDIGISRRWVLLLFIPVLNLVFAAGLCLMPGAKEQDTSPDRMQDTE